MKTLADYVKGYPCVNILLLAEYKDKDNNKYYLCKQSGYNNYYYMKGEEVIDRKYINKDHLESLSIKYINNKNNIEIINNIKEQQSYKYFVKFIKEQTGDDYDVCYL